MPEKPKKSKLRNEHPPDRASRRAPSHGPSGKIDDATFRSFIENLPVMFYAVSAEPPHTPIYISPSFEKFGYPLKDWLTKPDIWDRVIHSEDRDLVLTNTRAAMSKGESVDFEYRVVCKDKSILWVRDRSCFIKDRTGKNLCWQGVILDITERKLAEQELEKREKLYRTLARTIPKTAVLLFDHEFRYTLADGEQLKSRDWSKEMFENKTLFEVFPVDIADEWAGYYDRALKGEEITIEMENGDGAFLVNVLPVRDETSTIFAGMVMWQDVTERKRAADAIKESEARYRQLFENANDIIYVHDLDGNYISINQAAEQIFGYSRDEALALNMTKIIAAEHLPLVKKQLSRKIAGRASQTVYEVDCIRKDGTRATLEVNSSVIEKDGKAVAVQGIARDITERKHAEDTIRRSEERYRDLFENANDLIYTHDIAGNFTSLNRAGEIITGYTRGEALKMNIGQVVAPEYLDLARTMTARKVDSERPTTYELEIIAKQGHRVTLELSTRLIISPDGMPIGVQGVGRDITERRHAELALQSTVSLFASTFESTAEGIIVMSLDRQLVACNNKFVEMWGIDPAIVSDRDAPGLVKHVASQIKDQDMFFETLDDLFGDPTLSESTILELTDGRLYERYSQPQIMDGEPVGRVCCFRDMTARSRAEAELHNTVSLFATTFESTADGIVVMSLDGDLVACNAKFVEMWDVDEETIANRDGKALVNLVASHLKDPAEFILHLGETYSQPESTVSELLELSDGRIIERYSQPQYLEGKAIGRVASFRDITERCTAEEKLRHYALHDTLTDLPNRVEFMNQLRQAVARADGNSYARFAVLFLDLDRFKVINDSLGHAVGDKLLIAIAEKLTACVRPGDVVARLGGDEFTILLNRSGGLSEVVSVAERLQAKISEPFKIDNYEVFTTASIGIVASGNVSRNAEDFLRDADAAMYRAKEAGKARYEIFDQEMHVRNINLLQVETDLRHAVERNEFEVHYQPIVNLLSGHVDEFEALIRWRHPVNGLVAPNEFVHVAEETGLIIPIGMWILHEACRQTAEWQSRFRIPLSISVNLSAKQLMHPNLNPQVKDILLDTGLRPGQLKLEVTESTVMEHSDRSLKVLSELDALGIDLSTDDFGTGYSSLSYLQKFPFERLKIDRSFINIMDEDEKSGAIVKTILMLGENLNIEVVAEGIETASQLEKLRSLGCVKGQGYLFSRPIDREAAEAFLESGANVFDTNPSLEFRNPGPVIEVADVQ